MSQVLKLTHRRVQWVFLLLLIKISVHQKFFLNVWNRTLYQSQRIFTERRLQTSDFTSSLAVTTLAFSVDSEVSLLQKSDIYSVVGLCYHHRIWRFAWFFSSFLCIICEYPRRIPVLNGVTSLWIALDLERLFTGMISCILPHGNTVFKWAARLSRV
jgi:hypothetical protein